MNQSMIQEFMSKNPVAVSPNTTLDEAKKLMKEKLLHHLPVIEDKQIVGVISETQCLDYDPKTPARDVMIQGPFVVRASTPLSVVTDVMVRRNLSCAIVDDGRGAITGIFTTTDALKILSLLIKNPSFIHRLRLIGDGIDYEQIAAMSG